jgi:hypothetical protein
MITPDEFNDACKYVQNKIVRETLDYEDNIKYYRRIRRTGKANEDKIKFYKEVRRVLLKDGKLKYNYGSTGFDYPDDYNYLQALFFKDEELEEITNNDRMVISHPEISPSEIFPLYVLHSDYIEVIPDSITRDVYIYYYRQLKDPKFTYKKVSGSILFNESATDYQDFEIPDSIYDLIFVELSFYFGIQLKMPDVTQAMNSEDKKNEINKRL